MVLGCVAGAAEDAAPLALQCGTGVERAHVRDVLECVGGILLWMHVAGRLLGRSRSAGLLSLMALLFEWTVGGVVLWPEDFPGGE